MKYTEAVHAANLIKMLAVTVNDLGSMCPSSYEMSAHNEPGENCEGDVCSVCQDFVGIEKGLYSCPCPALGETKAIRKTKEVLKEKGYI